MITKNQLLEIIDYAAKNNISEAKAVREMGYSFTNISFYKRKYGIELKKRKSISKWAKDKYFYCINYTKGHNHTNKSINVFDINGNLIRKCASIKEASEFTKCNYSTVSHLGIKSSNHYQSNGFMFSREDKQMESYVPHYTLKTKDTSMFNEEYYKKFLEECNNKNNN